MGHLRIVESFNRRRVTIGKSSHGYGFSHFAKRNFRPGDVVVHGYGRMLDHQTKHCSIQIHHTRHILPYKWTGRYWNHSCDPNTFCRTRVDGYPELVALHAIEAGEEITYSYAMSERSWSVGADEAHIRCLCGARTCLGFIPSFDQLTAAYRGELIRRRHVSAHLRSSSAIATPMPTLRARPHRRHSR